MRSKDAIYRLTGYLLIIRAIKARRFEWAGHVAHARPSLTIRPIFDGRPTSPKYPGGVGWEDTVSGNEGRLESPTGWPPARMEPSGEVSAMFGKGFRPGKAIYR